MAERRMAEVMRQGSSFGKILGHHQQTGEGPGYLCHFHRMSQASPIIITLAISENLRFRLQPAKRGAVNDAVPVPLKTRPQRVLGFGVFATTTLTTGNSKHRQPIPLRSLLYLSVIYTHYCRIITNIVTVHGFKFQTG